MWEGERKCERKRGEGKIVKRRRSELERMLFWKLALDIMPMPLLLLAQCRISLCQNKDQACGEDIEEDHQSLLQESNSLDTTSLYIIQLPDLQV
jgi:hypothetical protein